MDYDYLKYAASMNPDMLESLIRDYGQEVWNYAFLIGRNRSLADDITQDVFIRHTATLIHSGEKHP